MRRFRRDQDGGLIVFSLLVLISMLVLGGMAVDFMRQENNRVVLQGIADRSVLSAASLQQTIDGKLLVEDYFEKSGVSSTLVSEPIFENRGNAKRVNVVARQEVDTFFLRLIGIDSLSSSATANAIESSGQVEISLIIDVSASMRSGGSRGSIKNNTTSIATGGRIGDLRDAAIAFSNTVLDPVYEGQVSLNIIPYGGHVNPGPEMFALMNGQGDADDNFIVPFDAIVPGDPGPLLQIVRDPDVSPSVDEFFLVLSDEAVEFEKIESFYFVNKNDLDTFEDAVEDGWFPTEVAPDDDYEYPGETPLRYSRDGTVVIDGTTVTNEMITQIVTKVEDPDNGNITYLPVVGLSAMNPLGYDLNNDPSNNIVLLPGADGIPQLEYSPPHSCMEILGANDWSTSGPPQTGQDIIPNYMIYSFSKWEIEEEVRRWGWCPQDETVIKYAIQDASEAEAYINTMALYDGTGTDAAMKWGLATLDPEMQPYFEDLNAMNTADNILVPDDFVDRPAPYDSTDTRKIIVLMTDGGVTGQRRANQPNNVRNILDITPNNQTNPRNWMGWLAGDSSNGGWTQIKSGNQARTDLVALCTLAKAEERDIKVYTVAFEMSGSSNTKAMKDCASTDPNDPQQYYFETSGAGLTDVFQEIAQQISELRLTK